MYMRSLTPYHQARSASVVRVLLAVALILAGLSLFGVVSAAPPRADDAGDMIYGSIGDRIFLDANGNGVHDPEETTMLEGVPVSVINLATGESHTVACGQDGYLVSGLPAGSYRVEAPVSMPGLARTTPAPTIVTLTLSGKTVSSYLDADFGYVAPTSVQLASFTAEETVKGMAVRWSTSWEVNQDGFRIWRSSRPDGPYMSISGFIPAANSPLGSQYEWTDKGIRAEHGYWYKIQSMPDGQYFGPVPGRDDPGTDAQRVFLPFLAR